MTLKNLFLGAGLLISVALSMEILAGCVGSRPGYVEDDYVYYPDYGVYYGQRSHQYVYLEGSTWTRAAAPSSVPLNVLSSSPSVQMSFHDSPEQHHSEVMGQYPGHLQAHDNGNGNDGGDGQDKDHGKGEGHD